MFLLLLIVFVGSVLAGWLVPMIFKSPRPYGLVGDILTTVIVAVVYTFILYQYIVPLVGMSGWLAFIGSAIEGIGVGAVSLWVLRRIKK